MGRNNHFLLRMSFQEGMPLLKKWYSIIISVERFEPNSYAKPIRGFAGLNYISNIFVIIFLLIKI